MVNVRIVPNFMPIGQTVVEMWPIFDLCYACLDHLRSLVVGLDRCAKFGWNRHCSFEDIRFAICCALGLKMPIHAPFGFLGKNAGKWKLFTVLFH